MMSPHSVAARPSMSAAARRVNVNSGIHSGATPRSSNAATQLVSVWVLPVPAPATTISGSTPCSIASRCAWSRSSTSTPNMGSMVSVIVAAPAADARPRQRAQPKLLHRRSCPMRADGPVRAHGQVRNRTSGREGGPAVITSTTT